MDLKHVKRLLEIANKDLPKVEEIYRNLGREVENLNLKKRDAEATILKLNGDMIHLRISEAPAYDNNRLPLTPDEKEDIKELLVLKFTEDE
jgi:hypothetical protein